jgi:hypothetical protein
MADGGSILVAQGDQFPLSFDSTSQADKERVHRTAVMQLQQRYLAVQNKVDREYDDRLAGNIIDEMWSRKSKQWQDELEDARREMSRHESARADYSVRGSGF